MQGNAQERGSAWVRRDQILKAISKFTQDPELRTRLRSALGQSCPWEQGTVLAFADFFRDIHSGFTTFLRGMTA